METNAARRGRAAAAGRVPQGKTLRNLALCRQSRTCQPGKARSRTTGGACGAQLLPTRTYSRFRVWA